MTLKTVLPPVPIELKIEQRLTCTLGVPTSSAIPIEQPLASEIFMLYPPLPRPVKVMLPPDVKMVSVTAPIMTVYGAVPPVTVIVMVPSVAPGELTGVVVTDAFTAVGTVTVVLVVVVQPLASLTVMV